MIEIPGEGSCGVVELSSRYFALSFSPDKWDYTLATDSTRPTTLVQAGPKEEISSNAQYSHSEKFTPVHWW